MKRTTIIGVVGALALSALAGGVGVALAHDDGTEHHGSSGHSAMSMGMGMDSADMEGHMRAAMGEDDYIAMMAAMPAGMHQSMMEAMGTGCADHNQP
ncbi:MAG: hypothetical protein DYG91_05395 [Chloroflexi bacterium CFX7]|nr:hypothetical protein [Chloroflexi bacterium CFX7]RIL01863.1 MAG: hypothetical protein DCC78_09400 [bacterium]